jgi:hypothetical protein
MHLVSIRCRSAQPILVVRGRGRPQWNYGMQAVRKRTFKGADISRLRRYGDCMDETPRFRSPRWWPWAVAILLVIIVNITLLAYKSGECVGPTIDGACTSGPALSMDGTWILAVVSVAAIIYFARRLAHVAGARRG